MKVSTLIVVSLVVCALLGSASAQTQSALTAPNLIDFQQKSVQNAGVIQFSENIQTVGNQLFVIAHCVTNGNLGQTPCLAEAVMGTPGGLSTPFTLVHHTASGSFGEDVWVVISPTSGVVTVDAAFEFAVGQLNAALEQIQGLL